MQNAKQKAHTLIKTSKFKQTKGQTQRTQHTQTNEYKKQNESNTKISK